MKLLNPDGRLMKLIAAYTSPEEVQALKKQLILMNIDSREK
jgi:hypothetical protein